jgi:serine/threonine-protein kinase
MEQLDPPGTNPAMPIATVPHVRQICTLLVCDLADSTALMERLGDQRASELIERHDQLARGLAARHHGREIDKTDGFLLLFERPSHAVAWAMAYHRELHQLSGASGEKLRARVGIHMGDVVTWENLPEAVSQGAKPMEVEGLAKSIAARLAQLALPGQTLLTESAASLARRAEDEIETGGAELRWLKHGCYHLKGLPEPVDVFEAGCVGAAPLRAPGSGRTGTRAGQPRRVFVLALAAVVLLAVAVGGWYWQRGPIASAIPEKSVAVLPFSNDSGDPGQQFFSDGLSENLINALSQFAGLKVISRNSAFQFRNSKDTSAQIGKALGVAHLLEGSVQKEGGEVRITATLVNAPDSSILWSQRYDRPYQDLFALQDEITSAAAAALQVELLTAPGAVLQSERPPSGNLAAYAAYQHGVAYDALGTEQSFQQAIDAYTEAIRIDPKYAAAYAQLSSTTVIRAVQFQGGTQAIEAFARARAAVDTALALNPDLSLAHQARANLLQLVDMNWRGAEVEAQRALLLAPNDAKAQFGLAYISPALGRVRRAADLARQALLVDPRHSRWYEWLSYYLAATGQFDQAHQAIETSISLRPDGAANYEQLAVIEILRGDPAAALAAARKEPPGIWHDIAMTLALQVGPDHAAADAALDVLSKQHADDAAYQIAEAYALRNDPEATFRWLERAWSNRDGGVFLLLSDPLILRYKDDPRFAAFAAKVGLPPITDAVAMKL